VKDGSLAPILQSEMQLKGWDFTDSSLVTFFYSILNEQSFKELITLNCVPGTVSGLTKNVKLEGYDIADIKNWYPDFNKFDEDMIERAFIWTAAVEALKRLDSLIRGTLEIGAAIAQKFDMYTNTPISVTTLWDILGIPHTENPKVVEALVSDIDKLTPTHPIIKASEAEIKRITELMSGLILHDSNMYSATRKGLLDMTRNALADIWTDTDAARAAGVRTLVQKSLTNLDSVIGKGYQVATKGDVTQTLPELMVMSYNLTLNTIGRSWNVDLVLTSGVTVNSVKSKVKLGVDAKSETIKTTIQNFKLGRMTLKGGRR
jgi:hypothetical protein